MNSFHFLKQVFVLKSVENEGLGGTNFKDSIPELSSRKI